MFLRQTQLNWLSNGRHLICNRYRSTYNISAANKSIYVFGTFDTKGPEISYLAQSIGSKLKKWSEFAVSNTTIKMVDISTSQCTTTSPTDCNPDAQFSVDVTCRDLIRKSDGESVGKSTDWSHSDLSSLDRTQSAEHITKSLHCFIDSEYAADRMCGAIAVGGSGGTAMTSRAFTDCLPLGFPKVIISTMASSSMTEQYIGHSDLVLMPSIVDVSGINAIYKVIADNAACCMVGMAQNYKMKRMEAPFESQSKSKVFTVGVTMFGITTQSVEFIRNKLMEKYGDNINVLVFHATGTGGKCMEYLVENGYIDGVIDVTTTEVADYIAGGILPCSSERFDAAMNIQVPTVISLGAANVVNFGSTSSIPPELYNDPNRIWQRHNEQVTLMKANDSELDQIAKFMASKIDEFESDEISVLIPKRGISALDAKGSSSPFYEYGASDLENLSTNLKRHLKDQSVLKYVDCHINDEEFADAAISEFEDVLKKMDIVIDAADKKGNERDNGFRAKKMKEIHFPLSGSRREHILCSFYEKLERGEPIIGAGAGTGISAKCEVMGGADLVIIYNSGKYRMAGRGSLAGLLSFGDANQIVLDMANEVIPIVKQQDPAVPVLAGVNGTDPFRNIDSFLSTLKSLGFDGVQNFPTVGLIDGSFRRDLEDTGFGYDAEVNVMKIAKEKYDLITSPYVFDVAETVKMAEIGVDLIVIHLGLTAGGSIGAKLSGNGLDEAVERIQVMANAAYSVNRDQIVLVHGGVIANPDDVEYVLEKLPRGTVDGFYGASSMERLPVELSITETVRKFKALKL